MGPQFSFCSILGTGHSGGLVACWEAKSEGVHCCRGQDQALYVVLSGLQSPDIVIAGIYGSPVSGIRNSLWEETSAVIGTGLPVLLAGDFNTILDACDKRGGLPFRVTSDVEDFRHWVNCGELLPLHHQGPPFTWSNNRQRPHRIWERLDRAFTSSAWQELFPNTAASVLPRTCSDHAPLLIDSSPPTPHGFKPFRFEQFWFQYPDLSDTVRQAWRMSSRASPMGQVQQKIHHTQRSLRSWNRHRVGDLRQQVDNANNSLNSLLSKEQAGSGSNVLDAQIRSNTHLVYALENQWEIFWAQRARDNWLRHGDQNTKYFQAKVQRRRSRNRISQIRSLEGVQITDPMQIRSHIADHFQNHWTSRDVDPTLIPNGLFPRQLSSSDAATLIKPFSAVEIEAAVKALPRNKAPGPDGLPGEFYQKLWPFICLDIIKAIQHFHHSANMPTSWGSTHVVLIPKKENPQTLKDFCPISICDTKYKIISKLLVSRMKTLLPDLIGAEQGAFVQGRSIHGHLLLVQDVLHALKVRRGKSALFAAKIDLASAYDSAEWPCLSRVLQLWGFPRQWIAWIHACVTQVRAAVLVNGSPTDWIPMGRGLRQGDPLSPHLFILVVEVLSGLLRQQWDLGSLFGYQPDARLNGQTIPSALTHTLFADDLLIVSTAKPDQCLLVRSALQQAHAMTGLCINW
ncbi:hypothetical protein QJS10_CPA09g00565 [Acorus calamus]|uniref:Reverse transcriptase domain-containing protein n=1 Tax=Acorus calamus TaxID=4465 RepID=A0AAV9E680_ACOCL|nr:hypothetical protein QJS10_CPA09g00565 [Acorus calamus]